MDKYKIIEIDGKAYTEPKEIEYKEVDADQFISCGYNVKQSEIITDNKGFVTDDLVTKIDITQKSKSTDVINVATGSGKTTAVYRLIKKIITEDSKSIVIMATPFKALVEKDMEELTSDEYGIKSELITNYSHLDKEFNKKDDIKFSFVDKIQSQYIENQRIHITTINALLRNPGDTAFEQKLFKTNYFVNLLEFCKKRELRVYLFFDEIHASIHNFKNEFIHYLTMWEKVVHKCIVSTATYTEPVNIVIKHLAYLTNDNINIFESKRVKRNDVSPLDMVFFPEEYSLKKYGDLVQFIDEWINKYITQSTHFHIICYSRKLASCIHNVLEKTHYNTQLLTSETKKKEVSFDKTKNNIGTNFSTGVDITNPGDLLIVIFPCKYSDELIKGEEGIFYDGLPTILQSVGRMRAKGRVLFTIPPLKAMINSSMCEKLKNSIPFYKYKGYIEKYKLPIMGKEMFLKNDAELLNKYLKKKNDFVKNKIEAYETKIDIIDVGRKSNQLPKIKRPDIQFPNKSTFILEKGQEYLKYISYKAGKFITPYVVWAALHDQYINCSLDKIIYLDRNVIFLDLKSGEISKQLMDYFTYHHNVKHTIHFREYYYLVKILLTSLDVVDTNGIAKHHKIHLKLNGDPISVSRLIKLNEFYFSLVDSYFKIYYPKIAINITDRNTYLKFALVHSKLFDPNIATIYTELKMIIEGFEQQHAGKRYNLTDMEALSYFSNPLLDQIRDCIELLKVHDHIINIQTEESKGSFWSFKNGTRKAIISNFVETFINRSNRDSRNSYIIQATKK